METLDMGQIINTASLETQRITCPRCKGRVQLHDLAIQADAQAVAAIDRDTGLAEIVHDTWVLSAWTPCCHCAVSVWVLAPVEDGRS